MKIYELKVDDEIDMENPVGVSAISIVNSPAIETEWVFFSKEKFQDSYDDYPKEARENACRALRWVEDNGWGDCGQAEGKLRANTICNGEPVSRDMLGRIASFARHRQYKDVPYDEGCGGLMWDSWGGDAMINWASRKLEQVELNAVVDLDGIPLYRTKEEADIEAVKIGCEGSHPHEYEGEMLYMPCVSHSEATDRILRNQTEELCSDCVINPREGIELEDMLNEGYVISNVVELEEEYKKEIIERYKNKVNGNYTQEQFYQILASPNEPSIQDVPGKKIRYIYVVGGARAPLIETSRKFCREMIGRKQLVYRLEDIMMLNAQLSAEDTDRKIIPRPIGTDPQIFIWHGGANCAHIWVEIWFDEDTKIPEKQTRAVSKAINETPATGQAGQVNPKVVKNKRVLASKEYDLPLYYEYGLPVFEDEQVAVWKSELMGCKGEYDKIMKGDKEYYRVCNYVEETTEYKEQFSFKKDEEKKMIYSPAMVPDRLIRRFDGRDEYWVYFSKETIEKIAYKFLMEKRIDKTNLEHSEIKYDDLYLVESWIITSENDKAYSLGFSKKDAPMGSWMVGYKILNEDVWNNYIKTGKVKGLSVEGEFELVQQTFSKDEHIYNEIINIIKNTK